MFTHFWATSLNYGIFALLLIATNKHDYYRNYKDILGAIFCLTIIFISLLIKDESFAHLIDNYRYYYGFIFFYVVFKLINLTTIDASFLIVIAFLSTLTESLLLNCFPEFVFIKPYHGQQTYNFFLMYHRPLGFGINSSVTGALIATLLLIGARSKTERSLTPGAEACGVLASFLVMSGVGFISLIYYLIRRWTILVALPSTALYLLKDTLWVKGMLWKVSPSYLSTLASHKLSRLSEFWQIVPEVTFQEILFGTLKWGGPGGDFDLLNFVASQGLIGVSILLFWILKNINRANFEVIIIILFMSLHYGVFSSSFGQVIFALALCMRHNNVEKTSISFSSNNYVRQ